MYDQTQKVLLIIKDRDLEKNRKIKQQARLIDIFPTALELLGIKKEIKTDGVSLIPAIKQNKELNIIGYSETFYPEEQAVKNNEFAFAKNKKAVRIANKHKIIMHLDSNKIEVFDLEKDPNEVEDKNKKQVCQ